MTTPPLTNEDKNRLLAEAVGWTVHQIEVQGMQDVAILPPGVSIAEEGAVWKYCGICLPDFLTDANAALTLVKFAKRKGWYANIDNGDDWDVCIFRGRGDRMVWHQAKAPTLPLAISSAFARAFSLEWNWEDDL